MANVPDQAGKWMVQTLPSGLGAGKPSASFGGTGQCIPTQSKNPDAAWQVIKLANFSKDGALSDFKSRTVYPAYKPAYDLPELKAPNAYFRGEPAGHHASDAEPEGREERPDRGENGNPEDHVRRLADSFNATPGLPVHAHADGRNARG
jgi:ABC-type glycerol-3-phosphate transport system substrate-binding protein